MQKQDLEKCVIAALEAHSGKAFTVNLGIFPCRQRENIMWLFIDERLLASINMVFRTFFIPVSLMILYWILDNTGQYSIHALTD